MTFQNIALTLDFTQAFTQLLQKLHISNRLLTSQNEVCMDNIKLVLSV